MRCLDRVALAVLAIAFGSCTNDSSAIRVTNDARVAAAVSSTNARHEPVFYNGKTYQLDFAPLEGGQYAMAVNGMSSTQEKDAIAVATSALRYFKCPDGQSGVLTSKTRYVGQQWHMTARCG